MPELVLSQPPDVPNVPGVPPLSGYSDTLADVVARATAPDVQQSPEAEWGVFDQDGQLVIDPDNIGGIEFAVEYRISDYPMEEGEFASYNKVATPQMVRVTMSKGATREDRTNFWSTLEGLRGSLDLYNIVTPETFFADMNIAGVTLNRTQDHGAGMLSPEIRFIEIRTTGEIQFDSEDNNEAVTGGLDVAGNALPSAANPTPKARKTPIVRTTKSVASGRKANRGAVQTKNPTPQQITKIGDGDTIRSNGDGSYTIKFGK